MTTTAVQLPSFLSVDGLPQTQEEIGRLLRFVDIEGIISYVLGPPGTNIGQAEEEWALHWRLMTKRKVVWCQLPESAVVAAKTFDEPGWVAVFWTCAVFKRLNDVFFTNTDTLPFFVQHTMNLDEMQLAHRPDHWPFNGKLPFNGEDYLWGIRIASHVSPAPLLQPLVDLGAKVVDATSNSAAAEMCRVGGAVDACVTTEAARKQCGLVKFHSFGSPPMVFFGGISERGARFLAEVYSSPQFNPPPAGF